MAISSSNGRNIDCYRSLLGSINLAVAREEGKMRRARRKKKEKAFEEEGESGEPRRVLIRHRLPSTITIQEVTTRRWLEQWKSGLLHCLAYDSTAFSLPNSSLKVEDVYVLRRLR
ncbi:hypothetical protein BHM03_00050664 [Ensete ventricosum]|nr:hypothetical protein BHM03_00050664 [Ensete ventricosum]